MTPDPEPTFVSRGGLKLHAALIAFGVDVAGMTCADLGCSTGGFTDCLLQAGAAHVYAIDTAYGELAWKLRQDERVTVMERTNALHAEPPADLLDRGGCGLVVIDLGWTPQARAVPAAARWLGSGGRVISLVKPHYEVPKSELGPKGLLDDDRAEHAARSAVAALADLGYRCDGLIQSPIRGGKKGGKGTGNLEWLALLTPEAKAPRL